MRRQAASKMHVFLIELTIAILVFGVTSAIALGIFVKANEEDKRSNALTIAMMEIQTIAEQSKGRESIEELRKYASTAASTVNDGEFEVATLFREEKRPAGTMAILDLSAQTPDGTVLYEISVKKYFPGVAL